MTHERLHLFFEEYPGSQEPEDWHTQLAVRAQHMTLHRWRMVPQLDGMTKPEEQRLAFFYLEGGEWRVWVRDAQGELQLTDFRAKNQLEALNEAYKILGQYELL
ncbi:hypothetical protein GCM10027275_25150 [Rhabdobacter roseus]|uniref:Uncharacterized protein n=1 Tax=Rhabdobacter roseus TaxID=1655419 RepID=A0A840TNE7_9BACT|nr:hypothetical protein [Rhabdobacter roseus]MBB5284455.1 hypothetical protein [Rhabdobacter roseus]